MSDFPLRMRTPTGGLGLFTAQEMQPSQHLHRAKKAANGQWSKKNQFLAVTEARSAFRKQVDRLSMALGYWRWKDAIPDDISCKFRFIKWCGTTISRRVFSLVEDDTDTEQANEYHTRDQARELLEYCSLFVEATDRYVKSFPYHCHVRRDSAGQDKRPELFDLVCIPGSGVIGLYQWGGSWHSKSIGPFDWRGAVEARSVLRPQEGGVLLEVDLHDQPDQYAGWIGLVLGPRYL